MTNMAFTLNVMTYKFLHCLSTCFEQCFSQACLYFIFQPCLLEYAVMLGPNWSTACHNLADNTVQEIGKVVNSYTVHTRALLHCKY